VTCAIEILSMDDARHTFVSVDSRDSHADLVPQPRTKGQDLGRTDN
jgi:hypothetical protein